MALAVAQRCGIPEEVLLKAKEFLPAGFEEYFSARDTLEEYIKEYGERLKELEEEKNKLERLIKEQERIKEELKLYKVSFPH